MKTLGGHITNTITKGNMEKKTTFKEATVHVTSNGYVIRFADYRGSEPQKNTYVAKTLEEVRKILSEYLVEPKNI